MEMNTFKVYTKKTTPLLIFSTSLLFLLIYLFTGSVNSSPLYVLVVLLLVTILIVNFFLIIDNRPSIVLTRNKIILPKKNETVNWDEIKKIEFDNTKNISEFITITAIKPDFSRKKRNVPRVYVDYDDYGHLDYAVYEINLKNLSIDNELIFGLLTKIKNTNKNERDKLLNTMLQN